jgi:pyruvate-ferredoxin/flavodoxin oxidoreductase
MPTRWITADGNEAAATVAYLLSDVIAIYPITPASPMGEAADAWANARRPNAFGAVPRIIEMQSEGGAAGAVHGALQAGALATTFTASQGLLLMIPNMFKIAGELTPAVIHVAARAVASHALSIFGDHSDVMATRSTGWAMLCAASVQEAQDMALIAHAATLEARIPFLHFFDGFRTSHEIAKIAAIDPDDLLHVLNPQRVVEHRERGLTPDHPVVRGTAQNPDVFFQGREAANRFYDACPAIVQQAMNRFATVTGRQYHLFDYTGAPDADRVIVIMGSGAGAVREAVATARPHGERVGLLHVRLYRPFSIEHFLKALPSTVRSIAVLDRTKEPGATGEPLFHDVVAALADPEARERAGALRLPLVIGGRYGLGSKEFNPAMAMAVFDELHRDRPARSFSIGIEDDVTFRSLSYAHRQTVEPRDVVRAVFYGLGSDGTVGANKNTVKIVGNHTDLFVQAYFVYDSKKSGSSTVSHLRFSPRPIESTYLIGEAHFVACHDWELLNRLDVLEHAAPGATVLLNAPYAPDEVWSHLPVEARRTILDRHLVLHTIDASAVASAAGMGRRVNTVLQVCFFALTEVLPRDESISAVKEAIVKTYGAKGDDIVHRNIQMVDAALAHLHPVPLGTVDDILADSAVGLSPAIESPGSALADAPAFLVPLLRGHGDSLPVSSLPFDGTYPTGTSKWEKRNLADEIPVWEDTVCIQCGKCAWVCPHAAIRIKAYEPVLLSDAPVTFKAVDYRGHEFEGMKYTIQVAPEDCTGCRLCVEVCPARDKHTQVRALEMRPQRPLREPERENYAFFLKLPEVDRAAAKRDTVKGSQFLEPLFEYSGACVGCGETPYLKLATQLFGDRMLVANATGCSSIFGANLPTTPWTTDSSGRGPAWSNSLFEDNAEFGLGMRLAVEAREQEAQRLVTTLEDVVGNPLATHLLNAPQTDEADLFDQRHRVADLRLALDRFLADADTDDTRVRQARQLAACADYLVKKSVWIIGGDGWAYDIGFGGVDHVLASGANVNLLVLDTEVYSNTGGQASKATPRGAVARFAAGGKHAAKKNLALTALAYGNVYVAQIALGASDTQTVKAFLEAESYPGPSLIIAYAHCIAHGIDMSQGLVQQGRAVASGHWPLFRYDPRRTAKPGVHAFVLDSRPPSVAFADYAAGESRYEGLREQAGDELLHEAQHDADMQWKLYKALAEGASWPPGEPL